MNSHKIVEIFTSKNLQLLLNKKIFWCQHVTEHKSGLCTTTFCGIGRIIGVSGPKLNIKMLLHNNHKISLQDYGDMGKVWVEID